LNRFDFCIAACKIQTCEPATTCVKTWNGRVNQKPSTNRAKVAPVGTQTLQISRRKRVNAHSQHATFALLERERENASQLASPNPQQALNLDF
jgi:hypothetical protein